MNEMLSVDDIRELVKIIDYAVDQGAIKGWDNIKHVMTYRDKAALFVQLTEAVLKGSEDNAE